MFFFIKKSFISILLSLPSSYAINNPSPRDTEPKIKGICTLPNQWPETQEKLRLLKVNSLCKLDVPLALCQSTALIASTTLIPSPPSGSITNTSLNKILERAQAEQDRLKETTLQNFARLRESRLPSSDGMITPGYFYIQGEETMLKKLNSIWESEIRGLFYNFRFPLPSEQIGTLDQITSVPDLKKKFVLNEGGMSVTTYASRISNFLDRASGASTSASSNNQPSLILKDAAKTQRKIIETILSTSEEVQNAITIPPNIELNYLRVLDRLAERVQNDPNLFQDLKSFIAKELNLWLGHKKNLYFVGGIKSSVIPPHFHSLAKLNETLTAEAESAAETIAVRASSNGKSLEISNQEKGPSTTIPRNKSLVINPLQPTASSGKTAAGAAEAAGKAVGSVPAVGSAVGRVAATIAIVAKTTTGTAATAIFDPFSTEELGCSNDFVLPDPETGVCPNPIYGNQIYSLLNSAINSNIEIQKYQITPEMCSEIEATTALLFPTIDKISCQGNKMTVKESSGRMGQANYKSQEIMIEMTPPANTSDSSDRANISKISYISGLAGRVYDYNLENDLVTEISVGTQNSKVIDHKWTHTEAFQIYSGQKKVNQTEKREFKNSIDFIQNILPRVGIFSTCITIPPELRGQTKCPQEIPTNCFLTKKSVSPATTPSVNSSGRTKDTTK